MAGGDPPSIGERAATPGRVATESGEERAYMKGTYATANDGRRIAGANPNFPVSYPRRPVSSPDGLTAGLYFGGRQIAGLMSFPLTAKAFILSKGSPTARPAVYNLNVKEC